MRRPVSGSGRVDALVLVVDLERCPGIDTAPAAEVLGLTPSAGRMGALPAEVLKATGTVAATGRSRDHVLWLTRQACRRLDVSGQVELMCRIAAVDTLPRR